MGTVYCRAGLYTVIPDLGAPTGGLPSGYTSWVAMTDPITSFNEVPNSTKWAFNTLVGNPLLNVPAGQPCISGSVAVVMSASTYEELRVMAGVVNKLQEGFDIATVALIAACVLAGFYFGWRIAQRGGSQ